MKGLRKIMAEEGLVKLAAGDSLAERISNTTKVYCANTLSSAMKGSDIRVKNSSTSAHGFVFDLVMRPEGKFYDVEAQLVFAPNYQRFLLSVRLYASKNPRLELTESLPFGAAEKVAGDTVKDMIKSFRNII